MAKKKAAKKAKGCKCLEQSQEQLEAEGVRLQTCMSIDFSAGTAREVGPLLAVEWITKRRNGKKLPIVTCAYCPMCGKEQP